jgi:hypothetical protein
MAAIRDLVVHVNDELVSRHAFELATCLAANLGARLTVALVAAPVNAGVGQSAETASLAQQIAQAQRAALLGIADRLAMAHCSVTTSLSSCDAPMASRSRCSRPMHALRIC